MNYLRDPREHHGRIVGVSGSEFQSNQVIVKPLAELILDHPRARYLAPIYFGKHAGRIHDVLARGEVYVLAQIGNHCQGAVFEDGSALMSDAGAQKLERCIDEIALSIPGFFVGRFDIRFESESALVQGQRLKIIEMDNFSRTF